MKLKKKNILSFLLSLLVLLSSISAHAIDINGNIIDENKKPVEFANISLFRTTDTLPLQNTVSDSLGNYQFTQVTSGNYWIEISYIGYKTDTLPAFSVLPKMEIIQLPDRKDTLYIAADRTISQTTLQPEGNTIAGITVTATKPIYERKADRIIFNVENCVYSQGSDAMQALSKAPRVQVNNNDIKIAGRGNAAVLINDRLVRMSGEELSQYLRSIPSNDIQKIEVIPNPPAKYDAQGAALINIVLKKNRKQGWNGNVTGSFSQAQYQGGGISGTINYTKKKVYFNTSLSERINKGYAEEIHELRYSDQNWKDTMYNPQKVNSIFGKLGLNIDINDKNTIGFNYNGTWNNVFWDKEYITTRVRDNSNNDLIQSIKNNSNNKRNFHNHNAVLYYTLKIDSTGKKLDIGFDFFNAYRMLNRNYTNETYNKYDSLLSQPIPTENTYGKQNSFIYTFNADMEHAVKYGTWNYGAKFTHLHIKSNNEQSILQADNKTYLLDSTRSSKFDYKEYTEAIYGSFNKSFKKVELQVGLRLEFTQLKGTLLTSGEINKQQYLRPFPSLMLQYKKNDKHQLNFSINSRIERPAFWQLNPFRYYTTQFSFAEGNPKLSSVYSINTSIEYVLKQNFTFSIYYNFSHNNIGQTIFTDTLNKTYLFRWEGNRRMHDIGTYNQFYFSVKNHWEPTIAIDAYIDLFKSPYLYNKTKRITWGMSLSINNDFILDKKGRFTANLNYYFTPPFPNQEGFMRVYNKLDAGLKARLLKEQQLTLTFFANNILKSKRDNGYNITPNGQYNSYTNYYNDRVFSFSIAYKFGNKNLKIVNKQIENENINRAK